MVVVVYMYTHTCTHMYTHVHTCTPPHTHLYVHIHIHTHTHPHPHPHPPPTQPRLVLVGRYMSSWAPYQSWAACLSPYVIRHWGNVIIKMHCSQSQRHGQSWENKQQNTRWVGGMGLLYWVVVVCVHGGVCTWWCVYMVVCILAARCIIM